VGFEIDPKALGAQAARIVAGLLYEGKKPADFHLVYPEGPVVYLNAVVAQRISVTLPEAVLEKAQVVQAE